MDDIAPPDGGNTDLATGTPDYTEIMAELTGESPNGKPDSENDDSNLPDDDLESKADEDSEDDDSEVEKIKLKVNGKVIEKTQAEVVKMAQLYEATTMKLETAKREIEEARTVKSQLQTQQNAVRDLLGVMQRGEIDKISEFVHEKLGAGDLWDKAIVKAALQLYEVAKMSPEQREALENRKLVAKLRAEADERQNSEKQRAFEYEVNQANEHINIEVPKAIKLVGLPDTAFIREHIITTWRAALEQGKTPTAAAVANYVKKQLDEAKLLNQPVETVARSRPKATKESVARRANGNAEETSYQSWDDWVKNRGR